MASSSSSSTTTTRGMDCYAVDELKCALEIHLHLGGDGILPLVGVISNNAVINPSWQDYDKTKTQPTKNKKNKETTVAPEIGSSLQPKESLSSSFDRWTLVNESTLDYGYFCGSVKAQETAKTTTTTEKQEEEKETAVVTTPNKKDDDKKDDDDDDNPNSYYYITTAINYTNGPAHMGHAYEVTTADAIARYHRVSGQHVSKKKNNDDDNNNNDDDDLDYGVWFVTGADEHGQKIAQTAYEQGTTPIDICNKYSTGFRVLNQRLLISNNDYIRTTSKRHKQTAQQLWLLCQHDIYLDTYTGWYNVKEETFVTDNDAQLWNYQDPTTGIPLKQVNEVSYFFKMSRYQQQLIHYIEQSSSQQSQQNDNHNTNKSQSSSSFIQPEMYHNSILQRLKTEELRDLSISRTTFDWGISVPEGFDSNHVMYVWVDALSNYLTGVDALGVNNNNDEDDNDLNRTNNKKKKKNLSQYWPANLHVIGKDIIWFHTVIWPTLLMSAQLPLPKMVYAHGFVNDKDGKKMSKSLGNVIDPHDMLDQYTVDSFRWYLCKEAPYGGELSFSSDSLMDMHNADLCDNIGNCINRATTLCGRFCLPNGTLPNVPPPDKPPISNWMDLLQLYQQKMNNHELQAGCQIVAKGFSDINGWLQDEAPWSKKGDEYKQYRQGIVRGALEAIYILAHLLLPFVPVSGKQIFQKLGTQPKTIQQIQNYLITHDKVSHMILPMGTQIDVTGSVLYDKLLSSEEEKKAATIKKKDNYMESKRKKEQAKAQARAQAAAAATNNNNNNDPNQCDFTKLDIRVGQIVKVWHHETADKLFCEEINVGDDVDPSSPSNNNDNNDKETSKDGNNNNNNKNYQLRTIASGLRDYYTLEEMQNRKVLVLCNLKPQKLLGFDSHGMVLAATSSSSSQTILDDDNDNSKKVMVVELVTPPDGAEIGERVTLVGLENKMRGDPWTPAQVKKKKVLEAVKGAGWIINEQGMATWKGMVMTTKAGPCRVSSSSLLVNATIS